MSAVPQSSRSTGFRPRPSRVTSPATVVTRLATCSSNRSPCISRRRSNASFFRISRVACASRPQCAARRAPAAPARSPERRAATARPSAVPTNPVHPVTAMRLPASDSGIVRTVSVVGTVDMSTTILYQLVERHDRTSHRTRSAVSLSSCGASSVRSRGAPRTRERRRDARPACDDECGGPDEGSHHRCVGRPVRRARRGCGVTRRNRPVTSASANRPSCTGSSRRTLWSTACSMRWRRSCSW